MVAEEEDVVETPCERDNWREGSEGGRCEAEEEDVVREMVFKSPGTHRKTQCP